MMLTVIDFTVRTVTYCGTYVCSCKVLWYVLYVYSCTPQPADECGIDVAYQMSLAVLVLLMSKLSSVSSHTTTPSLPHLHGHTYTLTVYLQYACLLHACVYVHVKTTTALKHMGDAYRKDRESLVSAFYQPAHVDLVQERFLHTCPEGTWRCLNRGGA